VFINCHVHKWRIYLLSFSSKLPLHFISWHCRRNAVCELCSVCFAILSALLWTAHATRSANCVPFASQYCLHHFELHTWRGLRIVFRLLHNTLCTTLNCTRDAVCELCSVCFTILSALLWTAHVIFPVPYYQVLSLADCISFESRSVYCLLRGTSWRFNTILNLLHLQDTNLSQLHERIVIVTCPTGCFSKLGCQHDRRYVSGKACWCWHDSRCSVHLDCCQPVPLHSVYSLQTPKRHRPLLVAHFPKYAHVIDLRPCGFKMPN
jgi:hypothetical protein